MNRKSQLGSKSPIHTSEQNAFQQELKCAYHGKQNITNFCKCEQCLLPVCPTCIKVHTDQHKLNKSSPKFQEINKVIEEIKTAYERLSEAVEEMRNFLIDVESNKKINQAKIRSKLLEHRKVLIREFERNLIEMENRIMERIVEMDEEFIERIDQIDQDLSKVKTEVIKGRQSLETEDILKHIIIYFGNNSQEKLQKQVDNLKRKSVELTRNTLSLTVRNQELQTVEKAIERYLRLDVGDSNSIDNLLARQSRYDH